MTPPALAARGVVVRFGGLTAVDGVDLEIEERALVGIIGPNGAGKTTFFNALSGLVAPTSGRLFVGGADLTRKPAHVFARAGIARTFQTPRVFADMTVAESVRFGLEFAGRWRHAERATLAGVPDILAFLGLAESAALLARAITPARQRWLEIGMALATRPRVLLLDEVAAGLTQREVESVARLIRRCRDELGLAVVWIEHAVGVLLNAVERVLVLHQGRKLAEAREQRERSLEADLALALGEQPAAELEIFQHRHSREQVAPFGDQDQSSAHGRRGRARRQHLAIERGVAVARQQARQRLQQRALPGAVRADDRRDPPRGQIQIEPIENAKAAVAGRQPGDLQRGAHGRTSTTPSPR